MQQEMENEQDGKRKTRDIVIQNPVMPGDAHPCHPAPAPSPARGQEEVQHQPGQERRDKRDEARNINQSIDRDTFHTGSLSPAGR